MKKCGKKNKRTRQDGGGKGKIWYKQGGFHSVMFFDATPGGELMKTFETIIREVELPIRIVERSGNSMKEMVVRSNLF